MRSLVALPATFVSTRDALHAVAEHVLAAARYRAEKHIGLVPTPGGFGTPRFGASKVARIDGVDIVYEGEGEERRSRLTTLAAAADCVGVPLGAPGVYTPATPCLPDDPLAVDADAAAALAGWIALGGSLLGELRETHASGNPSTVTLWPEHFDVGCEFGDESAGTRAGYGASPGDAEIPEPYLYVGPWDASRKIGIFAAHSFGAAMTYAELRDGGDAERAGRAFFTGCASQLLGT